MHDVPFFDRVAPLYDLVLPGTDRAPLAHGLSLAERELGTVVDLGGGTGRAARALDRDPIVLDGSRGMLRKARDHDLRTIRGDIRELPFPDDSIDGLVSVDAFHHFPSIPRTLEEAFRVLAVGGVLVVREFDPSTLRGKFLVLGERLVRFDSTFFTVSDLESAFETAGFETTVTERGFTYTVVGVKPEKT
ncbi:MAG: class I SAM-dependent methyltransferase [Halanaeroarchaeum sp.]